MSLLCLPLAHALFAAEEGCCDPNTAPPPKLPAPRLRWWARVRSAALTVCSQAGDTVFWLRFDYFFKTPKKRQVSLLLLFFAPFGYSPQQKKHTPALEPARCVV